MEKFRPLSQRFVALFLVVALLASPLGGIAQAVGLDSDYMTPDSLSEIESGDGSDGASYVEGEALVVYRDEDASRARDVRMYSLGDGVEADVLRSEGFSIEDSWDFSAADAEEEERGADSIEALTLSVITEDADADASANDADGDATTTEDAIPSGDDVRVALVSKDGLSTEELIDELSRIDGVVSASPNYIIEMTAVTNDTLYDYQYALGDEAIGSIGYSDAYEQLTGGAGQGGTEGGASSGSASGSAESSDDANIVGVIDTGVDYTHPDLADRMWINDESKTGLPGTYGYDFADNDDDPKPNDTSVGSHGTHCAGIVAASTNNGEGIAGASPQTKIMALKIISDSDPNLGYTNSAVSISAFGYAIQAAMSGENIVALNCSWSLDGYVPALDYAINQAGKCGIMTFFAAGNSSYDNDADQASYTSPYCIYVASTNEYGGLSDFSDYGETEVDVALPGSKILSTVSPQVGGLYFDPATAADGGMDMLSSAHLGVLYDSYIQAQESGKAGNDDTPTDADFQIAYFEGAGSADDITFEVGEDGRLNITADTSSSEDGYVVFNLSWKIDNPFLADELQDFEPSDFVIGQSGDVYDNDSYVFTYVWLTDENGKNNCCNIMTGNLFSSDSHYPYYPTLEALNQEDETLLVTVQVHMLSYSDSNIVNAYLDLFGLGLTEDVPPYAYMSGTSMSCPMAAGSYAMLANLYPDETPLELRGRMVGGSVSFDTDGGPAIACGGRFSYDVALDDDAVNANTWAASFDTDSRTVTLYGRYLDNVSLSVDGEPIDGIQPSDDGYTLSATLDASLFDGAKHRFTVTDTDTERSHQARYAVPLADDAEGEGSQSQGLAAVMDLPEEITAETLFGALVSDGTGLYFLDTQEGAYAYHCADPEADDARWEALSSPGTPYTATENPDDGFFAEFWARSTIVYGYMDGYIHAFAVDGENVTDANGNLTGVDAVVRHASYDISTRTWSDFQDFYTIESPGDGSFPEVNRAIRPVAYNGKLYLGFALTYLDPSYSQVSSRTVLLEVAPGASPSEDGSATAVELEPEELLGYDLFKLVSTSDGLYVAGTYGDFDEGSEGIDADSDGGSAKARFALFGADSLLSGEGSDLDIYVPSNTPSWTSDELGSLILRVTIDGPSGFALLGAATAGLGDAFFLNVDDLDGVTWEALGSYGFNESDGLTPTSAAYLNGKVYISAVDTGTIGAAGGDGQYSEDSDVAGALYTFSGDEADIIGSRMIEASAQAEDGGSARVSTWNADAAETADLMMWDRATWTATAQDGYSFAGWYDDDDNLISADATYSSSVGQSTTLHAKFAQGGEGGSGSGDDATDNGSGDTDGTHSSDVSSTPGTSGVDSLPQTGDASTGIAIAAGAIALLGIALIVIARLRSK